MNNLLDNDFILISACELVKNHIGQLYPNSYRFNLINYFVQLNEHRKLNNLSHFIEPFKEGEISDREKRQYYELLKVNHG